MCTLNVEINISSIIAINFHGNQKIKWTRQCMGSWVVFTGGNNPTVTVYGNYSYACYRDAPELCN
jgi:hypothetical protein